MCVCACVREAGVGGTMGLYGCAGSCDDKAEQLCMGRVSMETGVESCLEERVKEGGGGQPHTGASVQQLPGQRETISPLTTCHGAG